MLTRCILCNGPMEPPPAQFTVALQEDPDAICRSCRSLTGEARAALREVAVARRVLHALPGSMVTRELRGGS